MDRAQERDSIFRETNDDNRDELDRFYEMMLFDASNFSLLLILLLDGRYLQ